MMKLILRVFTAFCIGTVITQMIMLGYFASTGSLSHETGVKVVALLNGIDISGNRLQKILRDAEEREQPDFEEILEARRLEGMNMDLRLRSQKRARDELSEQMAVLVEETQVFDGRIQSINDEIARVKAGIRDQGAIERQQTIQSLEADAAKDQLLRIYDDEKIDDVVGIIKAMPIDKRSEILAEFETEDEKDKLHEIIRRIGDGQPETTAIEQAGR
ncbi:hypothetical protein [Crateriforma spongiae]|nr:hypothetical protein [Crateriforma spongiae]